MHCVHAAAHRYTDLLGASHALAGRLAPSLPPRPPGASTGPRIGVYAEPGFGYVAGTWAAWLAGGVAVPLATSHPAAELDYVLRDAGVSAVGCCLPLVTGACMLAAVAEFASTARLPSCFTRIIRLRQLAACC